MLRSLFSLLGYAGRSKWNGWSMVPAFMHNNNSCLLIVQNISNQGLVILVVTIMFSVCWVSCLPFMTVNKRELNSNVQISADCYFIKVKEITYPLVLLWIVGNFRVITEGEKEKNWIKTFDNNTEVCQPHVFFIWISDCQLMESCPPIL